VLFTLGSARAWVVTSRLPVATSTEAATWSLIRNGSAVAFGRAPVNPVVVGPVGMAAYAVWATPPTKAAEVMPMIADCSAKRLPLRREGAVRMDKSYPQQLVASKTPLRPHDELMPDAGLESS
jgi:hypothetical protein